VCKIGGRFGAIGVLWVRLVVALASSAAVLGAVGGFWVRRAGALTVRRAVASADPLVRLVSSSISLLVALIAVFASLNGRSCFGKFAGLHDELPFSAGSRVYTESCLYLLVRRVTR